MKLSQFAVACLTLAFGLAWNAGKSVAEQQTMPPRALLVAEHLRTIAFKPVVPGISALKTIASSGVELFVLRIKPSRFHFGLALQKTHLGEAVADIGKRYGAKVAFNGGFFRIDKQGHKIPVGLLAINNTRYSSTWNKSGGYIVFDGGAITILPTLGNKTPAGEALLQSKPVLIEPGAKWAMNTNRGIPKKRTMVCIDSNNDVIVVAIVSGGLSLYEAGWLMRDPKIGGVFGCDSAIAMDGGGSTQIWVEGRPDLSFAGDTVIQNAVIIRQR